MIPDEVVEAAGCVVKIVQTDTRSFFASCEHCGEGVTATTRRQATKWAKEHGAKEGSL